MSFVEKLRAIFNDFRKEYAVPHSLIVDDYEAKILGVYEEAVKKHKQKLEKWLKKYSYIFVEGSFAKRDLILLLKDLEQK